MPSTPTWIRSDLMLNDLPYPGRHIGLFALDFCEFDLSISEHSNENEIYDTLSDIIQTVNNGRWSDCEVLGFQFRMDNLSWMVLVEGSSLPLCRRTSWLEPLQVVRVHPDTVQVNGRQVPWAEVYPHADS